MKKYLIDIHHGLGDVIHMFPVLHAIKNNTNQSHVALIVSKQYIKEFVLSQDLVEEVFVLNRKKDILSLFNRKSFFYDYGIIAPCIGNVSLSSKLLRIMGCKIIIHEVSEPAIKEQHRVDRNIRLASQIGIVVKDLYPRIHLDNEAIKYEQKIRNRLDPAKKTIGICIGGNPEKYIHDGITEMVDVKRWPIKSYIELIKMLDNKYNIILLGGIADANELWNNCNREEFNASLIDLLGKTTVMQSAAALSCCDLAAGNDTGMIHVAAAIGKKTLAVYCSTNPHKIGAYSPYASIIDKPLDCKYCYLSDKTFKCIEKKCLYLTTPIEFYKNIELLLKEKES